MQNLDAPLADDGTERAGVFLTERADRMGVAHEQAAALPGA